MVIVRDVKIKKGVLGTPFRRLIKANNVQMQL